MVEYVLEMRKQEIFVFLSETATEEERHSTPPS